MTDFILNVLNSNFAVAICTLLGTLVGAHLSARYIRREEKRRTIAIYYSEFVSAYTDFVSDIRNPDYVRILIAAIEKLRLFCNKEDDVYFSVLFHFVTEENPNPEGCKIAYENIQKAVRKLANK